MPTSEQTIEAQSVAILGWRQARAGTLHGAERYYPDRGGRKSQEQHHAFYQQCLYSFAAHSNAQLIIYPGSAHDGLTNVQRSSYYTHTCLDSLLDKPPRTTNLHGRGQKLCGTMRDCNSAFPLFRSGCTLAQPGVSELRGGGVRQ